MPIDKITFLKMLKEQAPQFLQSLEDARMYNSNRAYEEIPIPEELNNIREAASRGYDLGLLQDTYRGDALWANQALADPMKNTNGYGALGNSFYSPIVANQADLKYGWHPNATAFNSAQVLQNAPQPEDFGMTPSDFNWQDEFAEFPWNEEAPNFDFGLFSEPTFNQGNFPPSQVDIDAFFKNLIKLKKGK